MIELRENIGLNIDKSTWEPTLIGDLATEISKRVDNPANSPYDRFVGLEHFVSGDIKIKAWSTTENLVSSAKAFQAGDILFARRNAYLRRASMVDFDGCCSGDAFVLREDHDKVVPGFLAFLMNSNALWDFANSNAAGTMSKRVKWRDLANYEFLLPPKEEQAKLAELLWSLDEVIEREVTLINELNTAASTVFDSYLFVKSNELNSVFGRKKSKFPIQKLGNLISELQYGISEALVEIGEVPVLRMNNLQGGKLDLDDLKFYNPSNGELDRFILHRGDVLFNRTNSYDLVGKVSLFDEEGVFSFASYLIRIKTNSKKLKPSFLNFYLNTPIGLAKIRKYRTPGVSQSNINAQNLKHVPIPIPNLVEQEALMNKVNEILVNSEISTSRMNRSQSLQKSLINQVFS